MERVRIKSIEDVGLQEVVTIGTDTHTFVAEGFACHNSFVTFGMEPQFRHEGRPVDLVLCEGRGLTRSGAHTAGRDRFGDYWNVSGIAICWQGNFHDFAAPWLRTPQIRESAQHMWGWVAFVQGLDGLRVA